MSQPQFPSRSHALDILHIYLTTLAILHAPQCVAGRGTDIFALLYSRINEFVGFK
jgi:hypothetical protein